MTSLDHTIAKAGERRLYMGADTQAIQHRLSVLRKLRAELEAEYAVHPSSVTGVALAAVYSELSVAVLTMSRPYEDAS